LKIVFGRKREEAKEMLNEEPHNSYISPHSVRMKLGRERSVEHSENMTNAYSILI
jgi:hypothetical protein